MQTITLEITNNEALKVLQGLQEKDFIKILARPDRNSLILPGEPLSTKEFKSMITEAEDSGSVSLKEAKVSWAKSTKRTSPTRQIRVSNVALQNIDETIKYIAFVNQQPLNAIKVSEAIENTINRIAQSPLAFKECEQLPTKSKIYRQAVCLSWLIIYRISPAELLVLSIIHTSRSPSHLKKLRKIK